MSTIKNQYWNFLFFQKVIFKNKSSAQSLNFDWMWLVNKIVLTFSAPIKCAKAQFNLIILSRVMPHTTYYRQTDNYYNMVVCESCHKKFLRERKIQKPQAPDRQHVAKLPGNEHFFSIKKQREWHLDDWKMNDFQLNMEFFCKTTFVSFSWSSRKYGPSGRIPLQKQRLLWPFLFFVAQ